MTLELVAPSGEGADGGSHPRRARRAGRGAREHLLSHQRYRQDASQARSADAEAGAGCRGRKPRRDLRRDAVVEAHPRGHGGDARRPAVLPRARQGAAALGREPRPASITAMDHVVVSTAGSRAGRRALWRAARPRHGARPLASGLGPADVLPLRRSHRRGRAPAGQGAATRRRTGCAASAGASPTSTPPMRGWWRPASTSRKSAPAASRARG